MALDDPQRRGTPAQLLIARAPAAHAACVCVEERHHAPDDGWSSEAHHAHFGGDAAMRLVGDEAAYRSARTTWSTVSGRGSTRWPSPARGASTRHELSCLSGPIRCSRARIWIPEFVHLAGGVEVLGRRGKGRAASTRGTPWKLRPRAWCSPVAASRSTGLSPRHPLWEVPEWAALPAARDGRGYVADRSQYFSRPGPRLVDSLETLAHALHPAVQPLPAALLRPVRTGHPLPPT